ncbi:MAG: DinB family protein [Flavobacteriales bacterium]|nr:DinB family protein [Flavobacteriales bacterium]
MDQEFETYIKEGIMSDLAKLSAGQQPEWGVLTPQHMIEHVIGSWRISNGRSKAPLAIREDAIPERLEFLQSNKPFERGIRNPIMPAGLWPLRKPGLKEATEQLADEIREFFVFHRTHPDVRPIHPLFGPLNREQWLRFQYKHLKHHFSQFGIPFYKP